MPRIIKQARVIKSDMPLIQFMRNHIESVPFEPVTELKPESYGFVHNPVTGDLITSLHSDRSYLLTVRYDYKLIAKPVLNAETDARFKAVKAAHGHEVKISREDIKMQVHAEMLRTAPVATKMVNIIVSAGYVIVCTANETLFKVAFRALHAALGSITTSTVHINDTVYGLSGRLARFVNDHDVTAFGKFTLNGKLSIRVAGTGNKGDISVNSEDIHRDINPETLAQPKAVLVNRLSLQHPNSAFTLNKDFHFTGIWFEDCDFDQFNADEVEEYIGLAWYETKLFTSTLDDLLTLFKRPDEESTEESADDLI